VHDDRSLAWQALSRVAMLCNRATFKNGQEGLPIMKRSVNIVCDGARSTSIYIAGDIFFSQHNYEILVSLYSSKKRLSNCL